LGWWGGGYKRQGIKVGYNRVEERWGRVGWGRGKGQREVEGDIFEEKEERG
jgi:hypothetical protein